MSARDELAEILHGRGAYCGSCGYEDGSCTDCTEVLGGYSDAILAAGYTRAPIAEIQEQVNHMYAAAKQGENMFGENTASDHLRHFADKIGALLSGEPTA